ncbi:uncharacterized protein LOC112017806 isoform X1 [Quercus suber]|uniref:uncharacterized protein LOC112017806 isoform X1 n=1 Tax=Quercus suber TaxID=58331 RepID=UPI000CE25DFF|nr:uncharacterized protein LOC112017806 isoform X1 [Quercus suber]XP_023906019.1 uncharacterized protein LOC112017806 isoform X1 [Quercus suber]XP_023906020.1 uncharacterized protein LOC112017806 isoform X1 [Quercus suber]XP_023906021.1 uncharacterized protein LOC112017806 isoform X1 [Quercus suber]XP_023906022.1 uncharacterized protein LOC112017806 isoform X1 [Quercus suber]XP_023906023.1 uncharacterized protein LOC112017806 isoform X1 [Quercus suber]XP_023906024.1 uncharacterized protein LO
MSPTKHSATKKSTKCAYTDSNNFKSIEADLKYNDCYKRATIIVERVVKLDTLEYTFIPEVFKERTWTKLLNPVGIVYSEIVNEFFSNASVEGDHIDCWVRHKEFVITKESIQEFLEVRPPSQPIIVQYEDRLDSIEEMVLTFGGTLKKTSMNTIPFNSKMRTLAYVMIHSMYPVTNLTKLSTPRTIFLYDLFTQKEIDICGHIFHLLKKSIEKQNSRAVMPFPSLIMGLIAKSRLKLPSGLTVVQRDYPIGAHTVTRSIAHIKGSKTGMHTIPRACVEEEGGDVEEEIDRFTFAPDTSAQPSSSAPTRELDRLDRLLARVDQLYTLLDSHVQHIADQFAYVQGQITALSS